jgi:type II secretory ATPase GspE/PulE/Tfp pilus assembly ATPase PilB-like protein
MAVQAALTGHLVLSTLHTNDAASAVTRLFDLNVPPFLLSSCLLGSVAQRLVRRICDYCRREENLTEDEARLLGIRQKSGQRSRLVVSRGIGCPECRRTGLRGRIGLFEVLEANASLRRLIHDKESTERIKQAAVSDGMTTLFESALSKLGSGQISFREMMHVLGLGEA